MPIIVAPIAGILADRIGGRPILATGMALQAVALAWLAVVVTPTVAYEAMVVPFILAGIGMGLFFAPIANVVLSAVHADQEGKASGATNTIREVGGVFGVAVLAAIFSANGDYGDAGRLRRGDAAGHRRRRGRRRDRRARGPVHPGAGRGAGDRRSPGRRRGRARRSRRERTRLGRTRADWQGTWPETVAYPARMPSVVSHARAADGTDLLVRHWPPDEAEAGRRLGGTAVGVGPAGPRPRRTLRPVRARRRPDDRGRPRGPGVRPPRDGRVGRTARRRRTLEPAPRRSGRAARGRPGGECRAPGRAVRTLARRPHRRGLPPDRPTGARPRGPDVTGARLDAAGLEEATRPDPRARRPDPGRSRTASTARPCRATRRSPRRPSTTRSASRSRRRVSAPRPGVEQERVRALASGGFGIPTLVLHGEDDHLVPGLGVSRLRVRAAGRAPDLPGSAPRAPQRTRRARRSSTRSSRGSADRRSARPWDAPIRCRGADRGGSGTHRLSRRRRGHRSGVRTAGGTSARRGAGRPRSRTGWRSRRRTARC